jgi:hypothetical protein
LADRAMARRMTHRMLGRTRNPPTIVSGASASPLSLLATILSLKDFSTLPQYSIFRDFVAAQIKLGNLLVQILNFKDSNAKKNVHFFFQIIYQMGIIK